MIKIPDEVVEAAARGLARYNCDQWDSDPERFWPHFADQARAAIAATLNAWPNAKTLRDDGRRQTYIVPALVLPLAQEARDD
jgi:hypothetical protein